MCFTFVFSVGNVQAMRRCGTDRPRDKKRKLKDKIGKVKIRGEIGKIEAKREKIRLVYIYTELRSPELRGLKGKNEIKVR